MNKQAKVIEFNQEISIEDISCVLNPLLACDLKQILLITPEDIRLEVALAFSRITLKELFIKAGLGNTNGYRWISHDYRLPLGVAFRLAKVLGVSVEILFAHKLWFSCNEDK